MLDYSFAIAELDAGNVSSVTRLGNILDFGQPFKAFGNN